MTHYLTPDPEEKTNNNAENTSSNNTKSLEERVSHILQDDTEDEWPEYGDVILFI